MVQKGRGDMFCCNGCGNRLFSLDARYDSGTGWPCFFRAFDSSSVATESLTNKKVKKIQVKCKRCGHHLGHLYDDQKTLTGKRFCISPDRIALRD